MANIIEMAKKKKIIKEVSFIGSAQMLDDQSLFIFVETDDGTFRQTKTLSLSKSELKGVKKIIEFYTFD